ncbi:MAG TPA: hypothetical protein VGC30_15595 [Dokdonella sp.]
MRYLLCLAGGILLGAILAMTAANALQRRNAWPRAIMTVMQHELGRAREAARTPRCADADARSALAHLALLAEDPERALLAPGAKDRVFAQYAADLREAIAGAQAAPDCASRAAALTEVANACDACHRDYR